MAFCVKKHAIPSLLKSECAAGNLKARLVLISIFLFSVIGYVCACAAAMELSRLSFSHYSFWRLVTNVLLTTLKRVLGHRGVFQGIMES